jgi:hypothetical protein
MFDREASREKLLVSRLRELALKERVRSARPTTAGDEGAAASPAAADGDAPEDILAQTEREYLEALEALKNPAAAASAAAAAAASNPAAQDQAEGGAAGGDAAAGGDNDGGDGDEAAEEDAE